MMKRGTGLALITYVIATVVAMFGLGAPGGDYTPAQVTDFLSGDRAWIAAAFGYLGIVGALALLPVARGLRDLAGTRGDSVWGLGVAAMGAGTVGWFLTAALAIAAGMGGPAVREAVPLPVVYIVGLASNLVALCAPALLIGVIAWTISRTESLPLWVRLAFGAAGVCGVLAPFYFTYLLYLLILLILGGWLAIGVSRSVAQDPLPSLV